MCILYRRECGVGSMSATKLKQRFSDWQDELRDPERNVDNENIDLKKTWRIDLKSLSRVKSEAFATASAASVVLLLTIWMIVIYFTENFPLCRRT